MGDTILYLFVNILNKNVMRINFLGVLFSSEIILNSVFIRVEGKVFITFLLISDQMFFAFLFAIYI